MRRKSKVGIIGDKIQWAMGIIYKYICFVGSILYKSLIGNSIPCIGEGILAYFMVLMLDGNTDVGAHM